MYGFRRLDTEFRLELVMIKFFRMPEVEVYEPIGTSGSLTYDLATKKLQFKNASEFSSTPFWKTEWSEKNGYAVLGIPDDYLIAFDDIKNLPEVLDFIEETKEVQREDALCE
jgi:hypothetical protein